MLQFVEKLFGAFVGAQMDQLHIITGQHAGDDGDEEDRVQGQDDGEDSSQPGDNGDVAEADGGHDTETVPHTVSDGADAGLNDEHDRADAEEHDDIPPDQLNGAGSFQDVPHELIVFKSLCLCFGNAWFHFPILHHTCFLFCS